MHLRGDRMQYSCFGNELTIHIFNISESMIFCPGDVLTEEWLDLLFFRELYVCDSVHDKSSEKYYTFVKFKLIQYKKYSLFYTYNTVILGLIDCCSSSSLKTWTLYGIPRNCTEVTCVASRVSLMCWLWWALDILGRIILDGLIFVEFEEFWYLFQIETSEIDWRKRPPIMRQYFAFIRDDDVTYGSLQECRVLDVLESIGMNLSFWCPLLIRTTNWG